jgi:predicted nucleotidyltransferase
MATQGFQRILETLERHGVEYIVVGGVAAVLRGAPVTTFDIDALVRIDAANVTRLSNALEELDARFRENLQLRPTRSDLLAGGHVLLMTDSGPFGVLGFIGGGKRFEDVIDSSPVVHVGDLELRVLPLEGLIADKKVLARDKDLPMLRLLEAALRRQRRS